MTAAWCRRPRRCDWGLVDELVEPAALRARVQAYGEELAAKSPAALAAIRRTVTLGGGMPSSMAGYDLDDMVTIAPEVTPEPVPWNWKMLLENYIEPYHTQFVHPIIHDFAPSTGVEFDGWRGPDDNVIVRYVPFLER